MIVAGKKEKAGYYLFILPALIVFTVFIFGPMLYSFILSFFKYNLMTIKMPEFVGFDNFVTLFKNPVFTQALKNTAVYTLGTVPVIMALGLGIALLLNNKNLKAKGLFKASYYMPYVCPMVAVAIVFSLIFNTSTNGIANQILAKLGLEPLGWLSSSSLALPVIMILGIWKGLGYVMIVYLGGLLAIPNEIYEAASLDPISSWQKLTKITIPLLRPTTLFLLVTETIGSFQVFTPVQVLTDGGPGYSTTTLVTLLYHNGFKDYKMGISSAIAVILFLILLVLSILQNSLEKESKGGKGNEKN